MTREFIRGGSFLTEDLSCDQVFTPEDFTEEQKMIAAATEEFVEREVRPQAGFIENHEFDRTVQLLKHAGELGFLAADVPEEYGGLGLDKTSSALITEKMSRAGAFSLSHGAHVGIGSLPIVLFGNERQKRKYLPALASGEKIAAYALTEPGSGSDALGARATARLNAAGTHYLLNGEKQWITNSGFADLFIVYAKIDGQHFSAFIVEREYSGVSTGQEEKKMGIRGSSTRTLILEEVPVPVENLLGEAGRGHVIAFNILNIGRYKLGVGAVGAAKHAFQLTVQYADVRQQFNTPISQFTLTKEKLATMASRIYAVESSVYRTVGLFDDRMDRLTAEERNDGREVAQAIAEYAIECSINKVTASEMLDYVVDEGVQIHGGYGYMEDYEIERMYRDSRINRIFEGTNEINRLLVPGTLIRKALKGELPVLQTARRIQEELLGLTPEESGDGPLVQEKYLLKNAKKIAIMMYGLAVQKFGQSLDQEQEILVNLADLTAGVYLMESAILRAEKALVKEGSEKGKQKLLYTEIFCQEAFCEMEQQARETLAAVEYGDLLRLALAFLRKFTRYTPANVIAKKREAAGVLIAAGHFIV